MTSRDERSADPDLALAVRRVAEATELDQLIEAFAALPASDRSGLVRVFSAWFNVVIPVLRETLSSYLDQPGSLDVEEGAVDTHIRAWNLLGSLAIAHSQPSLAEQLFEALLQDLRSVQPRRGRVHKGTPYHQIGWAKLSSGDPRGAREYFVLAAIEDLIRVGGDIGVLATPASETLAATFAFTHESFAELRETVARALADNTSVGHLKLENPELLLLGWIPTETISRGGTEPV